MKYQLAFMALLVLLGSTIVACLNFGSSSFSSNSSPRVCVIRNCTLNSTTNVCGRFGRSNLCQRFANSCQLAYQSCISSTTYTTVALSRCSGISVGTRRQCSTSSSSSSSTLSSSSSSSLSNLLSSSSSSNSNVVPIIISRRRG